MALVIARHHVKDFDSWKEGFDRVADARKAAGEQSCKVYSSGGDRNHVVIVFDWKDLESAREYIGSLDYRMAMRDAGISEVPDFLYLEEQSG